ncbi:phage holin family protein [Irregularibacter muris]|uniref:Phage holin family protein n=1 Tax=Irregularibacter muris TaxID=1796619 RepID=A0AAE3HCY4_9FIRM|nr:phage holin family protein [Irregularibacter muris]MCR1897536.1 phage holin family protein [Irregularibacter muris]
MNIGKLIIRIIVSAVAIGIATFLTPGMTNRGGIWSLLLAAIVIGILDWGIAKLIKVDASPFGRGIVGFLVAALILYLTGRIVQGFNVSILGAIVGALILGVVDALLPGETDTM